MKKRTDIRVGCCGFSMARRAYFREFPLVEVQQTFYQPPRPETLSRWRTEAPPQFEFTLKAWQLITHTPNSPTYRCLRQPVSEDKRDRYGAFRWTEEVEQAWRATLEAARLLTARVIVFQCPASFTPQPANLANLRRFFAQARADAGAVRCAWEPRGTWATEAIADLCRELDLIPIVDPFKCTPVSGFPRYFRLHGITGYRYRYSVSDLEKLLDLCEGGAYCLFNNMTMVEDAKRFLRLVDARR